MESAYSKYYYFVRKYYIHIWNIISKENFIRKILVSLEEIKIFVSFIYFKNLFSLNLFNIQAPLYSHDILINAISSISDQPGFHLISKSGKIELNKRYINYSTYFSKNIYIERKDGLFTLYLTSYSNNIRIFKFQFSLKWILQIFKITRNIRTLLAIHVFLLFSPFLFSLSPIPA